jgi:hypothetical protein
MQSGLSEQEARRQEASANILVPGVRLPTPVFWFLDSVFSSALHHDPKIIF